LCFGRREYSRWGRVINTGGLVKKMAKAEQMLRRNQRANWLVDHHQGGGMTTWQLLIIWDSWTQFHSFRL
jgi:hypothetical protein